MVNSDSLRDCQQRAGGVFESADPAFGPISFGDPRAEYAAARNDAALFDTSDRTQLEFTGRDRAKFLHNFCTNDVARMAVGDGTEAFVTNVQGKVLGHIQIFADRDSLWIECVAGSAARLLPHFSKYQISEDVEFHDRSAELGSLLVAGPAVREKLAQAGLSAVSGEIPGGSGKHVHSTLSDIPVHVRTCDALGVPGYTLVAIRPQLPVLWQKLANSAMRPAGLAAMEALRIEAGSPLYGQDITDANLAQEVNRTSLAISFTKGCYLGQEPIARIDALGHVNQELRGVRFSAGAVPPAGSELSTVEPEPRVIGRITSSALSYDDDCPVALAYLRRNFNTPGMHVQVLAGNDTRPGVVFWPAG